MWIIVNNYNYLLNKNEYSFIFIKFLLSSPQVHLLKDCGDCVNFDTKLYFLIPNHPWKGILNEYINANMVDRLSM
ncbi:MAG: hypothetical protein DRQ78_11665 [Epsilonproteobacteria bacterium]|nr:MAG: hypothetical protein DRQ78_11665 [Campylobacterota bacterium]